MALEHRIYVVRKDRYQYDRDLDKYWAELYFAFNLGVVHDIDDINERYSPSNCFIVYRDDAIVEDEYGDPLVEISIGDLINELEQIRQNEYNPSVEVLLSSLKAIAEYYPIEFHDIVCLHYGY